MTTKNPKFKCPECGDTRLEEILTNVTVTTRVYFVDGAVAYGEQTNEGDCENMGFHCGNGHVLRDGEGSPVCEEYDLLQWFESP